MRLVGLSAVYCVEGGESKKAKAEKVMTDNDSENTPRQIESDPGFFFSYPEPVGPHTRGLGTALLYAGKLGVLLPRWSTSEPYVVFRQVCQRAFETESELSSWFGSIESDFERMMESATEELQSLPRDADRLEVMMMSTSGSLDDYNKIRSWVGQLDFGLKNELQSQRLREAAAFEFYWRVYELFKELDQDPDRTIGELERQAADYPHPDWLLNECLVRRMVVPEIGFNVVTTHPLAVRIPEEIGRTLEIDVVEERSIESRAREVSLLLFDTVLSEHAPKLSGNGARKIVSKMEAHSEALQSLRKKCRTEARRILAESTDTDTLELLFRNAIGEFEEEVGEILRIDQRERELFFDKLKEDASVATALGGLLAGLTGFGLASVGITLCGSVLTAANVARNERKEKLRESPWSFVHYLQK